MRPFLKKRVKAKEETKPQLLGTIWYRGYKINSCVNSILFTPAKVCVNLWLYPNSIYAMIIDSQYIPPPPEDPSGEKLRTLVMEAIERQKRIVDQRIAKDEACAIERKRIESLLVS